MLFFADTANTDDIKELHDLGLLDGVTTNPSLIAKAGKPFLDVIAEICAVTDGPVSAEVISTQKDQMIAEGRRLAQIADNVVIKVPLTLDGLGACKILSADGHKLNVTLCFSAVQAMLAAKAGATYISPFIGRLDDIGVDGMDLIAEIRSIYDNYNFTTQVLAASARSGLHIRDCALLGADAVTAPAAVIKGLAGHLLTEKGLDGFTADAQKANIVIL